MTPAVLDSPAASPSTQVTSRRVLVLGGSGLIGRGIVNILKIRGDQPVILSRDPEAARRRFGSSQANGVATTQLEWVQGDPTQEGPWTEEVARADAVINLVGHPVFPSGPVAFLSQRWNQATKNLIRSSRVESTRLVSQAIARARETRGQGPAVWVQASAIGYYGPTGDAELDESAPPGSDFLAEVCVEWERMTETARSQGVRVVVVRVGVVLEPTGGALSVMVPLFRWIPGAAAPVGGLPGYNPLLPSNGAQWLSWIHHRDIVALFLWALDHPELTGPLNGTAPKPVRNAEFTRELAAVLKRPALPIGPPKALMRLLLGEGADVIATGQRVLPRRALEGGFAFAFPDLKPALEDFFRPRSNR
ncbi:TIGR01777 family oxidoreductase [Isosphaera pallida]|uniref:TIGR01777 family oxidoreductase n=1 Tax=Isosphaera pallida TaxID=128 RepID=UPI00031AE11B|nr:TIGR01777 family oxidoreductase [Isosphaera pallida]